MSMIIYPNYTTARICKLLSVMANTRFYGHATLNEEH